MDIALSIKTAALILFISNYIVGWLLHYRRIALGKLSHQILFAALLISVVLVLIISISDFLPIQFIFCLMSLIALVILPFGKKGGRFHIVTGTAGLILYILMMLFE